MAAAGPGDRVKVRRWQPPWPVNVSLTLAPHRRGKGDPTCRVAADGAVWRTCRSPEGPATLRLSCRPAEGLVEGAAWGPGASWALDRMPALLGYHDDACDFDPAQPVLRSASRRLYGLRIGGTGRVLEALVPAVLEQKVTGTEARRGWRALLRRYGEPAPGPATELRVVPPPDTWARIPSWEWHRAGVEAARARTVVAASRVATRMEETLEMSPAEADRRLRVVPGVGAWTAAEVRQRAHGDPDAVSVGDYHLPGLVGWALAGERADDAGMLELLAPYAGHRHRVTRLLELSGVRPPRRAPRMAPRDYRAI